MSRTEYSPEKRNRSSEFASIGTGIQMVSGGGPVWREASGSPGKNDRNQKGRVKKMRR